MDTLWQTITVGVLVVAAVVYLAARFVRTRRKQSACGSCALLKTATEKRHQSQD